MSKYKSLAIVGTQWGDEGKGKITNYFSHKFDYVVRYQGGDNAGHSIKIDGKSFALHLLPSGIMYKNVINVLANGMVINLESLFQELNQLKQNGVEDFNLIISERAHLILPYHKKLDGFFESYKEENKIGTTKRGIGPAYSDKSSRTGIRVIDLFDDQKLRELLKFNLLINKKIFQAFDIDLNLELETLYEQLISFRELIRPYVKDTSLLIYNALNKGEKVLFEGAQGVLLGLDHGTYPFVTSSSPSASSIPLNTGIPHFMLNRVLGIAKAYSTRVGTGVFPSEFDDHISQQIRKIGNEFGTTTGRARRIGWFDAVLLKYSCRVSGITDLSITLLDVLSGLETVKIVIGYKNNQKEFDYFPADPLLQNKLEPIYLELKGWKEDISNIRSYDQLPLNAKEYLKTIEKYVNVRVSQVSVGPEQSQTINIHDIFEEVNS